MRISNLLLSLAVFTLGSLSASFAQEVLVTSSGQSLDAFTVRTMANRAGVENVYDPLAETELLDGKTTLVIAVGASIKGFGAAGITAEVELSRTQALIEAAKADGLTIVGVHVGGPERRGGQSEQFIQLVAENADALIVSEAGNSDGYFTTLAEERGIPVNVIAQPAMVGAALAELLE